MRSEAGPLLIEDGVFWSREVEAAVPRGLDDDLVQVRRIDILILESLFVFNISKRLFATLTCNLTKRPISQAELSSLRSRVVARLEEPSWQRCGRGQNRFVVFRDGVHACAR